MFAPATFFLSGMLAHDLQPFRLAPAWRGPRSKLRLHLQGVQPTSPETRPVPSRRVFVTVSTGGGTRKDTEFADWSEKDQQWLFNEVLTLEVDRDDEICLSLFCTEGYNLVVAKLDKPPRLVGMACVPLGQLMAQMRRTERELNGKMYAAEDVGIDLRFEGAKTGRLNLSFEAKGALLRQKLAAKAPLCGTCTATQEDELAFEELFRPDLLSRREEVKR